jgi:cytochrome P450
VEEIQALAAAFISHNDAPFDMTTHLKTFSLNVILRISFSLRSTTPIPSDSSFDHLRKLLNKVPQLEDEFSNLTKIIEDVAVFFGKPNLPDFFPTLKYLDPPPPISWEKPMREIGRQKDKIFFNLFEQHRETLDIDNPRDFVDILLSSAGQLGFSDDDLQQIAFDAIAAGTDTSSTTGLWFIRLMARYPSVQQQVYEEMVRVCKDHPPTMDHKDQLLYLNAVILEVMRFKTVAPLLLPRFTTQPIQLYDKTIPTGNIYFICV